ncbi:MAG: glycosyltransferase [Verrucomicrobiota bacterium]
MSPKKILYVHNSADIYGASRCLVRLLQGLDRTRFTPCVLLPEHGPLEELLARCRVETILFPRLSTITRGVFHSWQIVPFLAGLPVSIWSLRRILVERGIDLVHTNTGVMLSGGPAAWLAGVPHVWHIRDWFQEFRGFWRVYRQYIRLFSDRILASSVPIQEQFPRHFPTVHLQDGMDLAEFDLSNAGELRRAFRQQYGLGDDPVVAVFGRIKLVRKGQETLLRAAAHLRQRGCRAKFLVVGAPFPGNESHLGELQRLVREGGIGDSVVFTGELKDPRPAWTAVDISVLTSGQPEPFGGVVLEAMCLGLPVVATRLGGSLEQVVEGETGFLVPPSDPVALADRLELLLGDEALRRRLGAAGRQRILDHFPLAGMVARIERLYDELLNQR